ncbi:hypothetical protein F5B20DRAFT_585868 [Whalleya microplaca]|nr:hypothetical protein F5B20DRAFT_585868 [Whalleya microplaca]
MNLTVPTILTGPTLSNLFLSLSSSSTSPPPTSPSLSPSPSSSLSWKSYLVPAFLAYALLCRTLRFRREKALRRKFGFPEGDRAALARMTNDQAQQIIRFLMTWEFPLFHYLSLEFALFKTYGVETISRLLLATRNLTDPIKSRKRYEDTGALIGEFMINAPTSERALRGLARVNYLHSPYVAAGQITNDDLLYTLSVFVTEPRRFARRYEWRALNDAEVCAYGVFWKAVGDALGVQYAGCLPRNGAWADGIEFFEDIEAWAKDYEVKAMRPSPIAAKPAEALFPMILYWVPWFARDFAAQIVCVLLGDRAREAFMLPEPDILPAAVVYSTLALRRFVLRHLCLPRLSELRRILDADPATGRYRQRRSYGHYPFYVAPTLWNRWGPLAWAVWLYGGKVPGDDPLVHMPQGYRFEDLGPEKYRGKGVREAEADVERLRGSKRGGCPFG